MLAGAASLLGSECARQDSDILRRAAQAIVKLVLRVKPAGRKASHDRVFGRVRVDHEFMLLAVTATNSRGLLITNPFTVTQSHIEVTAKIPGADKAKALEIANAAKAGCPISRLLKANITMEAKIE